MTPSRFRTKRMHCEFKIVDLREMDVITAVERQLRRLEGQEQADAAQTFVILSGTLGMEEQIARRLETDMIDLTENKVLGPVPRRGLEQGREEGRQEGREEGERVGMLDMLRNVLEARFGALPAWATDRLARASSQQLRAWARGAAQADSLERLLQ